jgi:hypothetical protein
MGGFAMTIKREREREGRRIVKKGNSGVLFFYDSFSFFLFVLFVGNQCLLPFLVECALCDRNVVSNG